MKIGNLEAIAQPSVIKFLYYKFFGLPHYGSRVRFAKIKNLFNLSDKTKVLDVGCGNGSYLNYASYTFDCSGIGVDRLESGITVARRVNNYYSLGNQFIVSDINDYLSSITEQKFDCILCVDVLEHIEKPQEVLGKCIFSLTPKGKLILSVPTVPVRSWLFRVKSHRFGYGPDRHVVDGYAERELVQFVNRSSGKVVKRIETFRMIGQILWEISEKIRKINLLYYCVVPVFCLLSRLDKLSPAGTNSGLILVVQKGA